MYSDERPPEGVSMRAPVWPLLGILCEVYGVCCVVAQWCSHACGAGGRTWAELGVVSVGLSLLFLEECRVLSTVARGQRLSWLLREDHHGTEHGGRHHREFGFEYDSLEKAS
jgi:hypothetical protein